jgi:hypothetical protein
MATENTKKPPMTRRLVRSCRAWAERRFQSPGQLFALGASAMIAAAGIVLALVIVVGGWLVPVEICSEAGVAWAESRVGVTTTQSPRETRPEEPLAETLTSALKRDPVGQTLEAIRSARFELREDVATGRFLESYVPMAPRLDEIDERDVHVCRRGDGWLLLEAPYRSPGESNGTAQMRFVREDKKWKLENIRFSPRRRSP